MKPTLDLRADAIILDQPASGMTDILALAAPLLAAQTASDPTEVRAAFLEAAAESDFGLGSGIAVPHVAVSDLPQRAVCLVRTAEPIAISAVDGDPVDLFFVVLYPSGDPSTHLQFLAHLAGMCRSRLFRQGLREAETQRDVLELVAASEARFSGVTHALPPAATSRGLAIISVSGERAADAILVGLLGAQLSSAAIVDAQTVQDAAGREVPLFAGFRDLFGDPGGRRMIFVHVDIDHADELAALVERACEEERSANAELIVVPIASRWLWEPPVAKVRSAGH